jgi:hypothetical protein
MRISRSVLKPILPYQNQFKRMITARYRAGRTDPHREEEMPL